MIGLQGIPIFIKDWKDVELRLGERIEEEGTRDMW